MTIRARILLSLCFVTVTSVAAGSASAQLATWHACGAAPAANEVYIFSDPNLDFSKTCAALYVGFYPYSGAVVGGFGITNDNISSAWVGSGVRARVFVGGLYGHDSSTANFFQDLAPGARYLSMPAGYDNKVSSIRVVDASRSANCDDLRAGEFGLYNQVNFVSHEARGIPLQLDCVVLRYEINGVAQAYPRPEEMGIANDSVWSMRAGPVDPNVPAGWVISAFIYKDNNFANRVVLATSAGGADIPNLEVSPWLFDGAISSVKVFYQAIP